jgi:hypothetical protein
MHGGSSAAALLAQCHHEYDMRILAEILQQAEADAAEEGLSLVGAFPACTNCLSLFAFGALRRTCSAPLSRSNEASAYS